MKSYGEFCALSRALDLVGDRWNMLVIRELLISPSRYSDLQKSLPGIATNLLAQRLRTLEDDGVIRSAVQPAPVSARVYELTDWGRGLRTALVGLARWGAPLLAPGTDGDESQGRWLIFAVMALYPNEAEIAEAVHFPNLTAAIIADGDNLLLTSGAHGVKMALSRAAPPADVTIKGTSEQVFRTLSGERSERPKAAVVGNPEAVHRFSELTRRAYTYELDLAALNADRTNRSAAHGV
ncbi:helix-turn-helix domain-containing protein [Antrihabitans sp. YC2-6]|uniref:winged helix-turn-helix transcriptional regulator n=1 Tax=Antrihabitans sp. YC2-6 TaxID=2799498 RepID=UPI0018F5EA76|nr:helix-turn-helix domain-containing protein [Antrihabitans sp. YC2-6]MBJ8343912.1 helix-turn-helix transcriptional regulator [Antrihabitans sp. YC2-6]